MKGIYNTQKRWNGFNGCNFGNPDNLADAGHPYCRMIDPNWVIKYPETQCRAQVYGQTLSR